MELDDNGQPVNRALNRSRRLTRTVDEAMGFVRGIVADGIVSDEEIIGLAKWLLQSREFADAWPVNVLLDRVSRALEDRRIDEDERSDLSALFRSIVEPTTGAPTLGRYSTEMPISNPLPEIVFPGRKFVFTGTFVWGTRKQCEEEVCRRGGACRPGLARDVDFLVVGVLGSEDWVHSSFGRKIEKAVELVNSGVPIKIVPEEHWVSFLMPARASSAHA